MAAKQTELIVAGGHWKGRCGTVIERKKMGKSTGFLEYGRQDTKAAGPKERIKHFNEFHTPLSRAKREVQAARCMNCGVPFCHSGMMIGGMVTGCPLHNLIPEWNDLVYTHNWEAAFLRLRKTNPFPEFTGRVCPHPCEVACTCNLNGDPVAIRDNELDIIEWAYKNGIAKAEPPKVRTGKKVAVVGSGPAGLSAANSLNKRGHQVTVFERSDRVGGLLMYGIPNMKLEKHVIERKVAIMEQEGIVFRTGVDVGADIKAAELVKEYDSVVLACGASNPRDINVKGRSSKGIYFAVDFLKAATKSLLDSDFADKNYVDAKGKRVLIIGGGDTGNDCVGTSIRLGAKSVLQLEMMPKLPEKRREDNPWPQWPKVVKTDYGQEEAIAVFGKDPRVYQTTVKEFIANDKGEVIKAKLVKLDFKPDKKTGRMAMSEVAGSEYEVPVDLVLIAAGFLGCQKYVADAFGVSLTERSNVKTAPDSHRTNKEKIFTAGDMHRGQSLVVWAIKEGRDAAREVDLAMMGYTNLK